MFLLEHSSKFPEQARVSYEFQGNQIHTIQRASSGNGDAQYQLATVSVENRWYWICHAAHHRHDEAMEEFAQAYRFGYRPMGRDLQRAMIWYLLLKDTQNTDESSLRAADKKITNNDIEQVAQELTLEQITEIELLVAAWQPNPSECGVETSQQSSQGEP